jgi:inhibitor of cysteine peptidase
MRRPFWGVLAFILLASLGVGLGAACSGSSASLSGSGNDVNVDSSYSGKQVELSVGQTLVVTLASNVTTGYSWSLTGISDESVLQKSGNEYIAPTTNLVGAGGQDVWTFKALKKGTSTISMGYSRPWETDTPPIETFGLTVVVN